MIVQPVVEPMEHYTALVNTKQSKRGGGSNQYNAGPAAGPGSCGANTLHTAGARPGQPGPVMQ